jgi:Integrase zinc binding domain/Integrase core domain
MLAVHLCAIKYRDILSHAHGISINIESDHADLLAKDESASKRVRRMWHSLLEYPIVSIKHVSGVSNVVADYLSRMNPPTTLRTYIGGVTTASAPTFTLAALAAAQHSPIAADERQSLTLDESQTIPAILMYESGTYWVPQQCTELQTSILQLAHDRLGHGGPDRTLAQIKDANLTWTSLEAAVEAYCASCATCILSKSQPSKKRHGTPLDDNDQPKYRLQELQMDYLGPFDPSKVDLRPGVTITARYVLVLQDAYTRFIAGYATESADGANTITALEMFFTSYGTPSRAASDNGSHFKNNAVIKYLGDQGVSTKFGIPHHPESQARVERQMSLIQRLMRAGVNQEGTWATHLPYIFYNINCLHSRSIGTSPYHAFFGTAPPTALRRALDMPAASSNDEHERQTLAAELSRLLERAEAAAFTERSRTHARHHKFIVLSAGDYVALWIAYQRDSKLSPYRDIRRVVARVSDSAYIIQRWNASPNGTNANQETITCHIDRLERITQPRDLPAAEAKRYTIRAVLDGLGVVSRISQHRTKRGRRKDIQLRVHWAGIDEADETAHNIEVWISPSHLSRCQVAQDYLASIITVPSETASTPTATPSTDPTAIIPTSTAPARARTISPARSAAAQAPARARTSSPARRAAAYPSTADETTTGPRRSSRPMKPKTR